MIFTNASCEGGKAGEKIIKGTSGEIMGKLRRVVLEEILKKQTNLIQAKK